MTNIIIPSHNFSHYQYNIEKGLTKKMTERHNLRINSGLKSKKGHKQQKFT